ncbi:hypothetical protein [Mesorhizobium sp. M7A.F.Ca.CA.002.12.1.1]|uniref:hypothetical protein n=1 Tax=Mesorhizobium sp. M7A.F.Ca.CA.002.12.1.1 TaxID=2496735 RepID=UPI000FC9F9D2|nr:hypothetical protein [Mesorhizobium sp. M7A.F.Ca.CA.002.12.1.1]RUX60155.1 hypothetical protein EN989_11090 [Mesorhizobium sp. M7A.F.Ca.CA.002.12.1.1]
MANRVLLGAVAGSYKLLVSKPGSDVTLGLPNEQLAFSSDWPDAGKILQIGSIALASNGIVQMSVPFFSNLLNVVAMVKIGSVFWPMTTLSNVINNNASAGLRHDIQTVAFNGGQGSGSSSIVYYAIMENQF